MRRRTGRALRPGVAFWVALSTAVAGAALAAETTVPGVAHVGTYVWTIDDPLFGGMSAIDVAPDGTGFVALSDRSGILSGQFRRDGAGRIAGIEPGPIRRLRGTADKALPKSRADSEGLAVAPDGTLYVSFEIAPRVLRYDKLFGSATILPIPRDFNRMAANGALEALAIAPDGALYTMPEESFLRDGSHPVYRYRQGKWDQPFSLPRQGGYLPVGADFGPDGKLYLLERSFDVFGFASRVKRFTLTGTGIDAGETLIDTPRGTYGDLEGLAVWRDGGGTLRLTMISDNNFNAFFETEVVEYTLPD